MEDVVRDYSKAKRRLLVLGYNSTLTTAVEAPRQPKNHYDQIKVSCTCKASALERMCGGITDVLTTPMSNFRQQRACHPVAGADAGEPDGV